MVPARGSTTTPAGLPATTTCGATTTVTMVPAPRGTMKSRITTSFTLYAVDLPQLPVEGKLTGAQVRAALTGHVLAEATLTGVYSLNPALDL